jgi:hypothetical protein
MDANKRKEDPGGDQHAVERGVCPPGQGIKSSTTTAPNSPPDHHQHYDTTGEIDYDLPRLEDDQFEALPGNLKTKGTRPAFCTETQNLVLVRIVKNVEDRTADGGRRIDCPILEVGGGGHGG